MTIEEHGLMIGVLAKQLQLMEALITVLKSRQILENDDMAAFEELMKSQTSLTQELIARAQAIYSSLAGPLGIQTGLEPE